MDKDPNKVTRKELEDVLYDKMRQLLKVNNELLALRNKHNDTLRALLSVKQAYPHVFEECVTQETIDNICAKE